MIQRIQLLGRGQRLLIFILVFGGGLMLIVAITVFLILQGLNAGPREVSRPIQTEPVLLPLGADGERLPVTITGREYAVLEDEEAYPSALALAADGTLYTGSYASGAIWSVSPDGSTITELPDTRDIIGSVTGLALADDGTLYVTDGVDYGTVGGTIWRIREGQITDLGSIPSGFEWPEHLTLDAAGNLYVVDFGMSQVWRYTPDGDISLFWEIPPDVPGFDEMSLIGIAYDPTTDTLILTEAEQSMVFRVSLDGELLTELYRYTGPDADAPNFHGVAVSSDGLIFLAAQNTRRLAMLLDGELFYLAENFRQITDVAVSAATSTNEQRVYATNMDARSLIIPATSPQRPFSIDEYTLTAGE